MTEFSDRACLPRRNSLNSIVFLNAFVEKIVVLLMLVSLNEYTIFVNKEKALVKN